MGKREERRVESSYLAEFPEILADLLLWETNAKGDGRGVAMDGRCRVDSTAQPDDAGRGGSAAATPTSARRDVQRRRVQAAPTYSSC